MKGIVLKDIYGCRFQIIGALLIMMLPMLIIGLIGGGLAADDFSDVNDNIRQTISLLLYGTANYISIVICSSFYLNTLKYDEVCGWTKIQRTMPLTGGQIVGGKLVGGAIIVGILTVLSEGFNILCAYVFKIMWEPMLALPLSFGLLELTIMLPAIVMGYKFGAKTVNAVYITLLSVMSLVMIAVVFLFMGSDIDIKTMRLIVFVIMPVLTAAVTFVCVKLGKKAVMVDI